MDLKNPVKLSEIADLIKGRVIGDGEMMVSGLNEIHKVRKGDMTFVDFHKYYDVALNSAASYVIINKEVDAPEGKGLIYSDDPFRDYNLLVKHFSPFQASDKQISDSASIGEGTVIMPGVVIGHNVVIGKDCIIHPNVVIYDNTIIGDNCIIHANTTIGADAFYFKNRKERELRFDKLLSCGKVVIEEAVEIGSNCTIDKGVSGDTIIGAGTKMDNSIHIGHGVEIGRNCLIAAQVGVAGKTIIGNNVILWGQVGVSKDLKIGDNAEIYAQSGVKDSIDGDKVYFGSPVMEAKEKMRELVYVKRLPEIWKKLNQ